SAYADLKLTFQGDGKYTVAVTTSTNANDLGCTLNATTSSNQFSIATSATVQNTEKHVLTRRPDEVGLIKHEVTVNPNPGSDPAQEQDRDLRCQRRQARQVPAHHHRADAQARRVRGEVHAQARGAVPDPLSLQGQQDDRARAGHADHPRAPGLRR